MFNVNVDYAAECIKSITDNTQCVTCDKLIGPCVRFPCGHSVCEDCAQKTGECLFCISSPASYVVDKPGTERLNNTSALLTAFQEIFKIDVYRRLRISDHLKAEKLVFPECIQAPQKYSNKRKSSNISFENKENIPKVFPGEGITNSDTIIMKKSVQYVQNWLNQHESLPQTLPRRPFGDINLNTQTSHPNTRQGVKLKNVTTEANLLQSTYRKRTHLKSIHKSSSFLDNVVNSKVELKKQPNRQSQLKVKKKGNYNNTIKHKCDTNESGIVLDDDPIVIEDTDTQIIDKDKQAWLDVLKEDEKAENNEKENNKLEKERETNDSLFGIPRITGSTPIQNEIKLGNIVSKLPKNVLFYKKSLLLDPCALRNNYNKTKVNSSHKIDKSNDVSIIINNSEFITTIKFTQCEDNKEIENNKKSVAIQTDEDVLVLKNKMDNSNIPPHKRKNVNNDDLPAKMQKTDAIPESLDVFPTYKDTIPLLCDNTTKPRRHLIIEDSDSDSTGSCNNTHEVVVDVHRTNAPDSVEYGILRTLSKAEYEQKTKRQMRGHTPNSSNSSDKENVDPNRKKAVKLGKKHKNKK